MKKWLAIGLVFVIVTVAVAAGTLFLLGNNDAAVVGTDDNHRVSGEPVKNSESGKGRHEAQKLGTSIMDKMMDNLAVLDYEPGPDELLTQDGSMTIKDSMEATTWVDKENTRLSKWKRELEAKQKSLEKLDKKISEKLMRIEQAESARIAQLAKLYDGMETRAVAKLMSNLDDDMVVAILPRMKSKNASQVLSMLPPSRAARLSKQMITLAEN